MEPIRQHLIDPEVCIRCNTCEATCPRGAISHDENNYVVDAGSCGLCLDCVAPCPTGAIDSWRMVNVAFTAEQQLEWDELPDDIAPELLAESRLDDQPPPQLSAVDGPDGGAAAVVRAVAPGSAAQPAVHLYGRDNPVVARVAGNYRITSTDSGSDIHHLVLDFGPAAFPVLEGQSIGIVPPGCDAEGKPHNIRLYSVASPRDGERPNHNNLALTIKRVRYQQDGEERQGVGSGYMCDLQQGDRVQVTGPFGSSFLMPDDPQANIIMICTGTGAAPFRAMTERRRRKADSSGKLLLFFGARTPAELPYFGPLRKLPESLIDSELVFSRLPGKPREYVQQRMLSRAGELGLLLRSDKTFVYLCGLSEMEAGVSEAFETICAAEGLEWRTLRDAMVAGGRYHIETY